MTTKAIIIAAALALTACQNQPTPKPADPGAGGGTTLQDHAIAGKTMRCELDGVGARITFSTSGSLSGRFLQASIDGTWSPIATDAFSLVANVGSRRASDTLQWNSESWAGSAIRCV